MQKRILRLLTGLHVLLYRFTGGRLGNKVAGLQVLVLTTTGRKSGKLRLHPLGYFLDQGRYILIASNGGREHHPDWFVNLKATPKTSIQVNTKTIQVTAQILPEAERDRLWDQLIQTAPLYAGYARRTARVIPLVALTPQTI